MVVELTRKRRVLKPWGVNNADAWVDLPTNNGRVGEVCYERPGENREAPALMFKLLFTSAPLSIQVHPDAACARSLGLANGKDEAWHILSAEPEAKVAVGLKMACAPQQLEDAIRDGAIADMILWRTVAAGDTIVVPAGTIHAIGAGLVICEIQQRSEATFRMFDYGRSRELQIDNAVRAATTEPAATQPPPQRLSDERMVIASSRYFTFERIALAPNTSWRLLAERETWLFVVNGRVDAGPFALGKGDTVFADADDPDLRVGAEGLSALVATKGPAQVDNLLRRSAARTGNALFPPAARSSPTPQ